MPDIKSFFALGERSISTYRHILIVDRADRARPLCGYADWRPHWTFVQPDPASAVPMCATCLKAADRVADLADRQEGIE